MTTTAEEESDSISRFASPFELIRNCDLPPPQKLFPGIDEPAAAAMAMPALLVGLGDEKRRLRSYAGGGGGAAGGAGGDGKLELLRALRLSQTRAREAEERGAEAAAERDAVATALIGEAARASAYRRWAWVLEHEVAALRSRSRRRRRWRRGGGGELGCRCERLCGSAEEEAEAEEEERCESMAWMVAFAIPLGIAGIGLALACRFLI
ncbi:uncharacterized protein LOC130135602 [Syzygium oleosum]|uniref:uncharacterized protein LOC130135602 n=1 Tax=Syzygium oleosum TaxID=219896 RepID=UPI0024BBAF0B|nr:uncharacterized protein LOC130135602 [Syzygium oleosum]